ncbi:MAG: Fic family protein [Verrucomicrobia bacterium]|nr:Fic family protein [Verrucomicrobiota bacterium]
MSPERLNQLRRVATIESIGSSTRIEGTKLSNSQVEALLSNIGMTSFKTRDEQEVAGYSEAMDLIFQAWEDMPLTENHLRQLHQVLLRHSEKDSRHRGEYRTLDNHVVAMDSEGNEVGVVFQTSTPFDTPFEMEELVAWVHKAISEESFHPLLMIGVFIVVFLAIHPFQDGNGRLSRVLTTLLLLRAGYSYVPFASLESVVEANKDLYYKALRRTQMTLKSETPDWEPWLGFFLRCLKQQKRNMAGKVEIEESSGDEDLPKLSLDILQLLLHTERMTIAEMVAATGGNQNTLKVRLRELVASGRINRHGKGRATWYTGG